MRQPARHRRVIEVALWAPRTAALLTATVLALLTLGATPALAAESPHSGFGTDTAKCASCHTPHAAAGPVLATQATTEALCLSCHTSGSDTDIAGSLSGVDPLTRHDVAPADVSAGSTLSCVTCHSPHRSTPDARYVNPDDRAVIQGSALAPVISAGSVYVLVGAAHDARAPAITNIVLDSSSDGTAPTITWLTDEDASSWVDWGLTSAYEAGNETTGTPFGALSPTRTHRVQMSGLVPGTTYHYRVRSADALGNVSVSADRTFTAFVTIPEEYAVTQEATLTVEELGVSASTDTSAAPTADSAAQALLAETLPWKYPHAQSALEYSVDTDRAALVVERRDGTTDALSAAEGWESASVEALPPTPLAPGTSVDPLVLLNAATDDGVYWRTEIATEDASWNWQVLRFDLGTTDLSAIRRISVAWQGHGEPTPGYPTAVYLWENGGWSSVTRRDTAVDADATDMRGAVPASLCLSCHDGTAPEGVAVPETLVNIATAWTADAHGAGLASGASSGALTAPYSRNSGAIDCTVCHDSHGSSSIYHVPASVNGTTTVEVNTRSQFGSLCVSCHAGTLSNWHASCVDCHTNGHWAGWVDPPVEQYLPSATSDCTSCHGHGKSWTHPATCLRCHGTTELKALGATPDAPWTYAHTF